MEGRRFCHCIISLTGFETTATPIKIPQMPVYLMVRQVVRYCRAGVREAIRKRYVKIKIWAKTGPKEVGDGRDTRTIVSQEQRLGGPAMIQLALIKRRSLYLCQRDTGRR